jgi:hypothetical protein
VDGAASDELREPEEVDVDLAVAAQGRLGATRLRPVHDPDDDARCDSCRHYLNPGDPIAYCWHPDHRALVGGDWVCGAWTEDPDP